MKSQTKNEAEICCQQSNLNGFASKGIQLIINAIVRPLVGSMLGKLADATDGQLSNVFMMGQSIVSAKGYFKHRLTLIDDQLNEINSGIEALQVEIDLLAEEIKQIETILQEMIMQEHLKQINLFKDKYLEVYLQYKNVVEAMLRLNKIDNPSDKDIDSVTQQYNFLIKELDGIENESENSPINVRTALNCFLRELSPYDPSQPVDINNVMDSNQWALPTIKHTTYLDSLKDFVPDTVAFGCQYYDKMVVGMNDLYLTGFYYLQTVKLIYTLQSARFQEELLYAVDKDERYKVLGKINTVRENFLDNVYKLIRGINQSLYYYNLPDNNPGGKVAMTDLFIREVDRHCRLVLTDNNYAHPTKDIRYGGDTRGAFGRVNTFTGMNLYYYSNENGLRQYDDSLYDVSFDSVTQDYHISLIDKKGLYHGNLIFSQLDDKQLQVLLDQSITAGYSDISEYFARNGSLGDDLLLYGTKHISVIGNPNNAGDVVTLANIQGDENNKISKCKLQFTALGRQPLLALFTDQDSDNEISKCQVNITLKDLQIIDESGNVYQDKASLTSGKTVSIISDRPLKSLTWTVAYPAGRDVLLEQYKDYKEDIVSDMTFAQSNIYQNSEGKYEYTFIVPFHDGVLTPQVEEPRPSNTLILEQYDCNGNKQDGNLVLLNTYDLFESRQNVGEEVVVFLSPRLGFAAQIIKAYTSDNREHILEFIPVDPREYGVPYPGAKVYRFVMPNIDLILQASAENAIENAPFTKVGTVRLCTKDVFTGNQLSFTGFSLWNPSYTDPILSEKEHTKVLTEVGFESGLFVCVKEFLSDNHYVSQYNISIKTRNSELQSEQVAIIDCEVTNDGICFEMPELNNLEEQFIQVEAVAAKNNGDNLVSLNWHGVGTMYFKGTNITQKPFVNKDMVEVIYEERDIKNDCFSEFNIERLEVNTYNDNILIHPEEIIFQETKDYKSFAFIKKEGTSDISIHGYFNTTYSIVTKIEKVDLIDESTITVLNECNDIIDCSMVGEKVTIVVIEIGQKLHKLEVQDIYGQTLEGIQFLRSENSYHFIMPEQKIVIWATFDKADYIPEDETGFVISEATHLLNMATRINAGDQKYQNGHYRLVRDIDLQNNKLEMIGNDQFPFEGVFDGGNYRLYNLSTWGFHDYCGLFRTIGESGIVENLNIPTVNLFGKHVGAIAQTNKGLINNVVIGMPHNTYEINTSEYSSSDALINSIMGEETCGAIASMNSGTLKNVINYANVLGYTNKSQVGGLVGIQTSTGGIYNSANLGAVANKDSNYVGDNYGRAIGQWQQADSEKLLNIYTVKVEWDGDELKPVYGTADVSPSLSSVYHDDLTFKQSAEYISRVDMKKALFGDLLNKLTQIDNTFIAWIQRSDINEGLPTLDNA
ncbi:hypothetical protein [Bacteroides sp. 51]|uniref:hypothetical protein n=1 Tax=Bacteroides sp. 51 TaxID=2302938 RepID=UPI0013D344A3|nr:hypothetical protein [Bacteroides sp. 51]NDV83400.1 hypothetical protein [Bacteroides sp. 51]